MKALNMKKLTLPVLFFYSALNTAQGATSSAAASSPSQRTLWDLLAAGGWVMIPLYLVSFAALALILFYFFTLRRSQVATESFKQNAEALIRERNFGSLFELAKANPQSLARVMEQIAGFLQKNPQADFSTVREIAQAEGNRQAANLNQQVVYLMDIGVLSPMLGLFGTVVGILRSFGDIAGDIAVVSMRGTVLAGGVSQALVATAVGLVVGIVAMFFYSYFRGRVQALISELETAATTLVAQLANSCKP